MSFAFPALHRRRRSAAAQYVVRFPRSADGQQGARARAAADCERARRLLRLRPGAAGGCGDGVVHTADAG
eukprot:7376269-Prymnesium_polylepis.1